jgi:hypothetical protein
MTFQTDDTTSASATEKLAAEAIAYEPQRWLMFAALVAEPCRKTRRHSAIEGQR